MTSEPWNEDEPLLDRLDRLPERAFDRPVSSPQFREALLDRSAMLLRRRRRGRASSAVGWLVAYTAGVATAYFALAAQPTPPAAQPVPVAHDVAPRVDQPSGDTPLAELSPWELERRSASADKARRPELLRLAGDRYLDDYADVQSALRCYRQLLDLVPPDEQTRNQTDDTWLLTSLKQARQSEAHHADTDT